MNILTWFAKNPIAANLLMGVILAGGVLSAVVVDKWVYPPTALDKITISLFYPGASPGEVEQSICISIEEALRNLGGIKKLTSRAESSCCNVTVEVAPIYPTERLLLEIKLRVDAIAIFPEQVEDMAIQVKYSDLHAITPALHGAVDALTLHRLKAKIRDSLLKLPEVARIMAYPKDSYEISVEVPSLGVRPCNQVNDLGLPPDRNLQKSNLAPICTIKSDHNTGIIR